jgi:hydroxymethylglutaryl-CoA synthase
LGFLFALARGDDSDRAQLATFCEQAGESVQSVVEELNARPAIGEAAADPSRPAPEAYPQAMNVVRTLRSTDAYRQVVSRKLSFGAELVAELGNLYTASLPAWIAAGFEDAVSRGEDLTGHRVLLIGYGSGDAAEAIPCQVVPGWEAAARKIHMSAALADPIALDRDQYERLHEGGRLDIERPMTEEFVVSHVGERSNAPVVDEGIEYYRFIA